MDPKVTLLSRHPWNAGKLQELLADGFRHSADLLGVW